MNEEKEDYVAGTFMMVLLVSIWSTFLYYTTGIVFVIVAGLGGYLMYRYLIVEPVENIKKEMDEKLRNIWFGGNDSLLDIKYLKEILPEKTEEIESKLRNAKTANDFKKNSNELKNLALQTRKKLLVNEIKNIR